MTITKLIIKYCKHILRRFWTPSVTSS